MSAVKKLPWNNVFPISGCSRPQHRKKSPDIGGFFMAAVEHPAILLNQSYSTYLTQPKTPLTGQTRLAG